MSDPTAASARLRTRRIAAAVTTFAMRDIPPAGRTTVLSTQPDQYANEQQWQRNGNAAPKLHEAENAASLRNHRQQVAELAGIDGFGLSISRA
jgi:hypothetical protein